MAAYRDPGYDYDFTNLTAMRGEKYERGGAPYFRPYGWKRYAIKVKGKYEDDDWLGTLGSVKCNNKRTQGDTGEWCVAYHGTKDSKTASNRQRRPDQDGET